MKKKALLNLGFIIIAICCLLPAIYWASKYQKGYDYFFNLFLSEDDSQLLFMANWYTSRCWLIVGLGIALTTLLMSVYSQILKANSFKYNIVFIGVSFVFAGIVFILNNLLGRTASLQFLLDIVNPIIINSFLLVFCITSHFDSKKWAKTTN